MNKPTAFITGATSGIGRATARSLAADGFRIIATGRDAARIESLRAELPEDARVIRCDLRDRSAVAPELLFDGPIHALVLNAGIAAATPLGAEGEQRFHEVLEVNLVAPMRLVRAALPSLVDGGRIVFVSSVLGRVGVPQLHGYCASKAGVIGLARALALDLAPRRITVNALCPTWVDTEMATRNIASEASSQGQSAEALRATFMKGLPLQRFLSAEEVAAWIGWLLKPEASGMTGQAVNVCLGMLAATVRS